MTMTNKKHELPCPYCHKDGVIQPASLTRNPHGHCPHCGLKPRASIAEIDGVLTVVKYSAEGKKRVSEDDAKDAIYNVRLSRKNIRDVRAGRAAIVPKEGTKTLAVIPLL